MEGKVEASFLTYKGRAIWFWLCCFGKFNQSGLSSLLRAIFDGEGWILNYLTKTLAKKTQSKYSTIIFVFKQNQLYLF